MGEETIMLGNNTFIRKRLAYLVEQIVEIRQHVLQLDIFSGRTVEEWLLGGAYTDVNPYFNTANFGKYLNVSRDSNVPFMVQVVIFKFGLESTINDAKLVQKYILGLEPVNFEHQLALGQQYPEMLIGMGRIVNPNVVWTNDGKEFVPYFFCPKRSPVFGLAPNPKGHVVFFKPDTWYMGLVSQVLVQDTATRLLGIADKLLAESGKKKNEIDHNTKDGDPEIFEIEPDVGQPL